MSSVEEQLKVIKRGTVEIIPEQDLMERLRSSRPLRIKAGFDPTSADIHLGHTVLLYKLRQFQELGHHIIFLIGDFTAQIGDPTGRNEMRKPLSYQEVKENARTYTDQAFKILDREKTEVVFNSRWYEKMSLSEFAKIAMHYTVARLLERDDFAKRYKAGLPITILELLYPLIQGYDSVMVKADVEIGGTDQKFNLLVGRALQEAFGQKPQIIITMPLLEGLDGVQKMSKSLGNYIGINEPPKDIFGKIMSISDELMYRYYELLTDFDMQEIKAMHPKEAKLLLAQELVARFYDKQQGQYQRREFERVFSQRQIPEDIKEVSVASQIPLYTFLVDQGLVGSKNQARRLIQQGAVYLNNQRITDPFFQLTPSLKGVLKVGKKQFIKLV